jgi:hypothetical protein
MGRAAARAARVDTPIGYASVIAGQKRRIAPRLTHDHAKHPIPGIVSYPKGGNVRPASCPGRPLTAFDPQSTIFENPAIREQARVSVADAHVGATVQLAPNADIAVITSDPGDIRRVAGDRTVTVVAI